MDEAAERPIHLDYDAEASRLGREEEKTTSPSEAVIFTISTKLIWTLAIASTAFIVIALIVAEWSDRRREHEEALRAQIEADLGQQRSVPTTISRAPRARPAKTIEPIVDDDDPEEPEESGDEE